MRGLTFPSLLCLIWRTSFTIASQCNVFSSSSGHGKYLKNHLAQSIPNTNLHDCNDQCIVAGFCRSTNFHWESKTCEMNGADKHDFPNDYIERQGYSYNGWQTKQPPFPKSCSEAKERDRSVKSGYYYIRTKRGKLIQVYCDMDQNDGGWTLVVSVSAANRDHLQRAENNCVNSRLCVQYQTTSIPGRKLSDQDIIDIMSEYGTFRIDVLTGSPYTAFYKIPSGARNFDSSCTGQGPPVCPRIIISHHYPYQWESNPCNNITVGYRIYHLSRYCVFDGHDDEECGGRWFSSLMWERRVLYGYRHYYDYGIYSRRQALVFVK